VLARKLGKIVLSTLLYLAVFDLAGVAVSFVLDVLGALPLRSNSSAAFYAVWFVLGVFCGLLSYDTNGRLASGESKADWTAREDAAKTGLLVVVTTFAVLFGVSVICYLLLWRYDVQSSYFVPDNAPLSVTFFTAVFASTVFAYKSLRSRPNGTQA
jgi:hypothetical protein